MCSSRLPSSFKPSSNEWKGKMLTSEIHNGVVPDIQDMAGVGLPALLGNAFPGADAYDPTKPKFSLIIATLGRTAELAYLLQSVISQARSDIEVIIVDQNADDRINLLLAAMPLHFAVHHLRTEIKNVSAARNVGLAAATGAIVAFPDDDCWYPARLLDNVDLWFVENHKYGVLAVGAVDDAGLPSGNRWIQDSCDIKSWNALRTTFCSSLFISAVELSKKTGFDSTLARAEETDFILRLLDRGVKGRFDRRVSVGHPRRDMTSGTVTLERAWSYGAGMGAFVRSRSLFVLWTSLLAYDLARAVLVLSRGRPHDASFCLAHAKGLFHGFMARSGVYD
jgi:hypothetical protein